MLKKSFFFRCNVFGHLELNAFNQGKIVLFSSEIPLADLHLYGHINELRNGEHFLPTQYNIKTHHALETAVQ